MSALTTPAPEVSAIPAATVAITPAPKRILVHIVGRVKKPGVFEMASGARLKDALHLAGGPLPNADLEAINLAEPVEDGQQYRVPARQEAIASATRTAPQVLAAPPKMASRTPRSARTSTESSSRVPEPKAVISATPAPIDINRATLEELQNLPGVGPATAQKIIEYRDEIGGFKSVDDLDGVKGIGPKKLEKMRPFALVR
jgi:competence protein ComEA